LEPGPVEKAQALEVFPTEPGPVEKAQALEVFPTGMGPEVSLSERVPGWPGSGSGRKASSLGTPLSAEPDSGLGSDSGLRSKEPPLETDRRELRGPGSRQEPRSSQRVLDLGTSRVGEASKKLPRPYSGNPGQRPVAMRRPYPDLSRMDSF